MNERTNCSAGWGPGSRTRRRRCTTATPGRYEHTSASVNGEPRTYTLRVTQVYRREDGEWKVAHRHADTVPEDST